MLLRKAPVGLRSRAFDGVPAVQSTEPVRLGTPACITEVVSPPLISKIEFVG